MIVQRGLELLLLAYVPLLRCAVFGFAFASARRIDDSFVQFHMVEATYRVKEARKQLYSENGRYPENEEVAEATGLSMKKLTAVLMTPKAPRSLDQKIGINQNLKPSVCPLPLLLPGSLPLSLPGTGQLISRPLVSGGDCRPGGGVCRGHTDEAVHEAGPGEGARHPEPQGEAGGQVEVRAGGWEDEDAAGDRGIDGREQGEDPADRILCLQKAEEQEENQELAPVPRLIGRTGGNVSSLLQIFLLLLPLHEKLHSRFSSIFPLSLLSPLYLEEHV